MHSCILYLSFIFPPILLLQCPSLLKIMTCFIIILPPPSHTHTLLSPISVDHSVKWTYEGTYPLKFMDSLRSYWLPVALHFGVGPLEIFLICVDLENGMALLDNLASDFMVQYSIAPRRRCLAAGILLPWLLLSFCLIFWEVLWILGVEVLQ